MPLRLLCVFLVLGCLRSAAAFDDPNDPNVLICVEPEPNPRPGRWVFDIRIGQQPPSELWLSSEIFVQTLDGLTEIAPISQGLLPPSGFPVEDEVAFSTFATSLDCFPNNPQAPPCTSLVVDPITVTTEMLSVQWSDDEAPFQQPALFTTFRVSLSRDVDAGALTLRQTPFLAATIDFSALFTNSQRFRTFHVYALSLCTGDLDSDLDVDLGDLAILLSNFGATSGAQPEDGDLDGDGKVDLQDLAQLLAVFGTICS